MNELSAVIERITSTGHGYRSRQTFINILTNREAAMREFCEPKNQIKAQEVCKISHIATDLKKYFSTGSVNQFVNNSAITPDYTGVIKICCSFDIDNKFVRGERIINAL